ncbi:hypothetical protein BRC81_05005 [Halobacteriales archaeon QS_1_68_20]|nr:MAG: hypothetical protein BRC81_05005 [Halobacteriales archaeon QS_1_68_20]
MSIDVHNHLFAADLLDEIDGALVERRGKAASMDQFYEGEDLSFTTEGPDRRVELMDEWGLDRAVLSFPSPESFIDEQYLSDPEIYGEFARLVNDYLAEASDRHPDRLLGFASVPLVDTDAAITELDRALDDLGLQGVGLDTNVFGASLIDEQFRAFFEHADDRGVPIFVHPTNPLGKDRLQRFYTESMIGFPMETTVMVAEMIFSGFVEQYDDLEIILSHLGGAIPYLKRRMEFLYSPEDPEFDRHRIADLSREPSSYLDRFWYDTSQTYPRAMEMAYDLVGDRLIFGSDYPFGPTDSVPTTMDQLDVVGLDDDVRERVDYGHAEDILLNL